MTFHGNVFLIAHINRLDLFMSETLMSEFHSATDHRQTSANGFLENSCDMNVWFDVHWKILVSSLTWQLYLLYAPNATFLRECMGRMLLSLMCCIQGAVVFPTVTNRPLAEVFHHSGVIKSRGETDFSIGEFMSPQPQVFWSIARADFYVEDNCHPTFFLPISSPKNTIFLETELLYFTGVPIHPIELSVLPTNMYGAFISSTHTSRYMCTQTHAHHSSKNTHTCKHRPQTSVSSSKASWCFSHSPCSLK